MKTHAGWAAVAAGLVVLALASSASAILVSLFQDTDAYLERAKDIVIVEVLGKSDDGRKYPDNLIRGVLVQVVMTLKGDKRPGQTSLSTIYPVQHGERYLVMSLGGRSDLLATAELSQVPLGQLDVKRLAGKPLKEQVLTVFGNRLDEVQIALAELGHEQTLLKVAVGKSGE